MNEAAKGHPPELELRKPFLLTCTMVFASLFAASGLIVLSIMMFVGGSGTTYRIQGTNVSREEFMARSGAFFAFFAIVVIFMGITAFGLYDERPWTRRLLAWYWPCVGVFVLAAPLTLSPMMRMETISVFLECAAMSLIGWWYLYRKRSVVGYYDALEHANRASSRDASAPTLPTHPA